MVTVRSLAYQIWGNLDSRGMCLSPEDTFVSWLPQYHDLGLVMGYLMIIGAGARGIYMSPFTFIARPSVYLKTIETYRGTVTGMPNFGFQLLVNKADKNVDLSSLRSMLVGAEPTRVDTMLAFIEKFQIHPDVINSGYGKLPSFHALTVIPLTSARCGSPRHGI